MTPTPQQLKMMRHMLGLPNPKRTSYRNRYYAPPNGDAHADLRKLEKAGLAVCALDGGSVFAQLTRKGAEMVLEKGETLDAEDWG